MDAFANMPFTSEQYEEFCEEMRLAGLQIEAATAEVSERWACMQDPYGLGFPLECLSRIYFARKPGTDRWVCFWDLPKDVYKELLARIDREPELLDPDDLFF